MTLGELKERFDRYVSPFRRPDGTFGDAMAEKYNHTFDVVEYAREIAEAEHFSAPDRDTVLAAALFHDCARFEQVRRFNTFSDQASGFDHGHEGARLIMAENFLAGMPPEDVCAAVTAVELHNKPSVDWSRLGSVQALASKTTRDSDKLAILKVLLAFLNGELKMEDDAIMRLGKVKRTGEFSPKIVDAALNGTVALHRDMRSFDDFLLTIYSWSGELYFPASAKIALRENFYGKLRKFLPAENPVVDTILKNTNGRLECLCSKSGT